MHVPSSPFVDSTWTANSFGTEFKLLAIETTLSRMTPGRLPAAHQDTIRNIIKKNVTKDLANANLRSWASEWMEEGEGEGREGEGREGEGRGEKGIISEGLKTKTPSHWQL
eukprot:TRINITY_DN927_c0_g1_i2.p1 TRINITY_DN927_c0_g1~~TRINITY_DN927_c0_g1_i2.p1  ORF type:complete len:111 (-),score=14.45 TRINITY_DN927_c0_g1_i2:223-555(-)